MGIRLELNIESDDDDAERQPIKVVLEALQTVITKIKAARKSVDGVLKDENGNTIGDFDFEVTESEADDEDDEDDEDEDPDEEE